MKNKTKSNLMLGLGLVIVNIGLCMAYLPLTYIFSGVLCIIASFGFDRQKNIK